MECNKDEAMRAKSIAEAKYEQKDYFGSKKFAVKAQTLYPGLDGISQMLTTLDVYCSAERKIKGLVDWYGVLGVDPTADDETIKKKYRKLALVLHPDKNPSSGADGAFKLISEAWSLLSDKVKRSAYNKITGFDGSQLKPLAQAGGGLSAPHAGGPMRSTHIGPLVQTAVQQSQNGGAPAPSMESPPSKFLKRKQPDAKPPKKRAKTKAVAPSPNRKVESFWTICRECSIRFEYHVMYRNCTLLCVECKKAFMAQEIPQPAVLSRPRKLSHWPAAQQPNSSNSSSSRKDIRNLRSSSVIC